MHTLSNSEFCSVLEGHARIKLLTSFLSIHPIQLSGNPKMVRPRKVKKTRGLTLTSRLVQVDAPLEAIVGARRLSRTDICKNVWAYIKRNNLQDPMDGRIILPDEMLSRVFGRHGQPIICWEMNKQMQRHIHPIQEPEAEENHPIQDPLAVGN